MKIPWDVNQEIYKANIVFDSYEALVRDCAMEAGRAALKESPPADEFERGFEAGAEYAKSAIFKRYGLEPK